MLRIKLPVFIMMVFILAGPGVASASTAAWIEGTVTRAPWSEGNTRYIGVNSVNYKIQSGIRITHRYPRTAGAWDERSASIHSITKGQKISVKIRKYTVIQIILF